MRSFWKQWERGALMKKESTISVSALFFYLHIISVTFYNHPHPILGAASTTCSTLIQIISVPGIFDLVEAILPQVSSLGYVPPPHPCLM